jgi:eukaryotic-like serine/threonine-protein kinase
MSEPSLAHQLLGRYQLLVAVARGGMGQVWLGRLQGARGFNKVVAIKTLLPNEADRPRFEGMLAEEARLSSLVQHANVVHTIELGEHDGLLYLVMEWVDGEPLGFVQTRASERGGMPLGVAVALVSQVLAGLHAAHELSDDNGPLGVVHRDVSPHNILVTYDGVAKLLDFGIAKATQQPSGNTDTGEIKGKFSYMAPEQILGTDVDRRCDVFATGIVLYWLATGRHPFKHENTATVIHAITGNTPVPPPSTLVEEFPAELERVLLKALEKDREKRWRSAEEMRAALEQAMPEAFGDAGRSALRAFMERSVGDRKLARREAVRRAQLAADSSDVGSAARALQTASSQSASSLRAIAISQPAPQDLAPVLSPQTGAHAAPPARTPRAPWIAAAAGIAVAIAVALPRLMPAHDSPKASASVGIEAGTALPGSEHARVAKEPLPPPSSSAAIPPIPDVKAAPVASAAPPSKAAPPRAGSKPKLAAPKRPASSGASGLGNSDLLAPDYAR